VKTLFVLNIVLLALVAGSAPAAEPDIADVPGEAAIINGDTAAAREMALGDARRHAIEQVLGAFVDSRVILQNELLSADSTFIQLAGAATVQNVYNESEDADGFYRLRALVKVYPNTLTQTLDRLAASAIVRINETVLDSTGKDVAASIVRAELAKNGFKVVDPTWLSGQDRNLASIAAGNMSTARDLGTRYMADVIIVGEVEVTYRRDLGSADIPYIDPALLKGMVACEARADIRAVDPKTGKVITAYASGGRALVGIGPTKAAAADDALRKASAEAASYLVENLPKPGGETATIQLTVRGVPTFQTASDLSGVLSRLRGVEGVKMGSYNADATVFTVSYREGEEMLARELAGLTSPSLSVVTVDKGRISVRVEK
jgi:hypothetical protein